MLHLITQSASSCISDGLGCTREISYVIFKNPGEVLIIPFDWTVVNVTRNDFLVSSKPHI